MFVSHDTFQFAMSQSLVFRIALLVHVLGISISDTGFLRFVYSSLRKWAGVVVTTVDDIYKAGHS